VDRIQVQKVAGISQQMYRSGLITWSLLTRKLTVCCHIGSLVCLTVVVLLSLPSNSIVQYESSFGLTLWMGSECTKWRQ
jgi:hypothetical protein